MFILEQVPLRGYSTMRLGGPASYLVEVTTRNEVKEALMWASQAPDMPIIMIGGGSNIVWKDEGFAGLVIVNKIQGFETYEIDENSIYITAGGGENWDDIVKKSVDMGYSGLEELSLIPGTVGATPVQNVGAYGKEISQVLTTIEAYDMQKKVFVTIPNSDCEFAYRTSRFKTTDKNRFFITAVTFNVTKLMPKPPFYDSVTKYFQHNNVTTYSPQTIRSAVIAIRNSKLPDPAVIANNGSFFKNPIVTKSKLKNLLNEHPKMMYWDVGIDEAKLSAAWLLEKAGFKDFHDEATGMATWHAQPLVFVNEKATSTAQLLQFRDHVVSTIKDTYDITLEQEPELI